MTYEALTDGTLTGKMALHVETGDLDYLEGIRKVYEKLPQGTLVKLSLEHHEVFDQVEQGLSQLAQALPGLLVVELDSRGTTPMPRRWMAHVSWLKILTNPKYYAGLPASEYILYVHDKQDLVALSIPANQQNIWLNFERTARDELLDNLRQLTFEWRLHVTASPSFRWEFQRGRKQTKSDSTASTEADLA